MADHERENNTIKLWKNKEKSEDWHADYKGLCIVDDVDYFADGYVNESKGGEKWIKIKIKKKEKQPATEQPAAAPAADAQPAPVREQPADAVGSFLD